MRRLDDFYPKQIVLLIHLLFFAYLHSSAQGGSYCYTPLAGPGTAAYPVASGGLCIACNSFSGIDHLTDADNNNFTTATATIGIQANEGLAVKDTLRTWPAGYYAGYVIQPDNSLLTANILQSFVVETYNDGMLQESRSLSNGLGSSVLAGNPGKLYLSFKTVAAFDEVRFVVGSTVSALHTFNVYYAMAFDSNCGVPDNNAICYDQLAGRSSHVSFNGGLLQVGTTLTGAGNITDGNKDSYATFTGLANLSLLSTPVYIGVKDLEVIYPGGRKTGFVIGTAPGLLAADVAKYITVETYLHGQLQESRGFDSGNGLLTGAVVSSGSQQKTEISLITDDVKPFNEVRLVLHPSGALSASLGDIRIYYAFESDPVCGNCTNILSSGQTGVYNVKLVQRDRNPSLLSTYNTTGIYGITAASLTYTANVVNNNPGDYASFNAVLGLLNSGMRITVENTEGRDLPANSMVGFAISTGSGLLQAGVLPAITIRLYNNNTQNPVQTISGTSLLNLGLLTGNSGPVFVGGKATVPFDEIELDINQGLLSAGLSSTYRIYYAYVIRDDDNDGVADCIEVCGSGNDALDSDGDGTPDACDACNLLNAKSGVRDTDADGVPDACDADSDNDGIADHAEDRNNDGDPGNDDADKDGIPNYLDLDSDNDGIPDLYESGIKPSDLSALDANHDGVIENSVAKSGNGMADNIEETDAAGAGNNYTHADSDSDNVPDYLDLDSDNDGINDITEYGRPGIADEIYDGMADWNDADKDGIMHSADGHSGRGCSPFTAIDTDGDGAADFRDLDSDNDGINDILEKGQPGLADANADGKTDGADTDGDGIMSSADGNAAVYGDAADTPPVDSDDDGIPDVLDLDSDNDSVSDLLEGRSGGSDTDNNGSIDTPDADGDGIMDSADGLPFLFGDAAGQAPTDSDHDGTYDYRDTDSDNDGIFDIVQNGKGTLDNNRNGQVDQMADPDGDGIANNGGLDSEPGAFGGLGKITLLTIKAMLQGALLGTSGAVMRDDLRQGGYIPLIQPYSSSMGARFAQYGGGGYEQTTPAVLEVTGNDAIVDWVFVELRSSSDPSLISYTLSALIQRDGDIVAADGSDKLGISLPAGNFYLALKHRNHLGVMTAMPLVSAGADTVIDFITMNDAGIYNLGSEYEGVERAVINGKKALWAGNGNADSLVKYDGDINDRTAIAANVLSFPGNINQSLNYALAFGYYMGDFNMNGNVKHEGSNNDRAALANIVLLYPLNTTRDLTFGLLKEHLP